MGMEMRAHASDRIKGDEELAEEEKARLEELEVLELCNFWVQKRFTRF
jgi:hypothetical protein